MGLWWDGAWFLRGQMHYSTVVLQNLTFHLLSGIFWNQEHEQWFPQAVSVVPSLHASLPSAHPFIFTDSFLFHQYLHCTHTFGTTICKGCGDVCIKTHECHRPVHRFARVSWKQWKAIEEPLQHRTESECILFVHHVLWNDHVWCLPSQGLVRPATCVSFTHILAPCAWRTGVVAQTRVDLTGLTCIWRTKWI